MTEEEIIEQCIATAIEPFKEKIRYSIERPFIEMAENRELTVIKNNAFIEYARRYIATHSKLRNEIKFPQVVFRDCAILPPERITHEQLDDNQRKFSFYNCVIQTRLEFSGELNNSYAENLRAQSHLVANQSKIVALEGDRDIEIKRSEIETFQISAHRLIVSDSRIINSTFSSKFANGAIFSNVVFENAPQRFSNSEFASKNVSFRNVIFKETNTDLAIGIYRSMKDACEKAHYEHGVILFHGYELETYYNVHLKKNKCADWLRKENRKDIPEKVSSWFHKGLTDYGRDVMRPFLCILYLFICGAWVNFAYFAQNLESSLLLAFKNSTGPMSFALSSDQWKKLEPKGFGGAFFAFFHIIASSIIWFLIVFMLRRRFKI